MNEIKPVQGFVVYGRYFERNVAGAEKTWKFLKK
jgi:hypothetical protein